VKKKLSTKASKEDLETWNNFIKNTRVVEDKDIRLSPDQNLENEKTYDLRIDLHGYTIQESFKKIDDLFFFAKKNNIKKALVITGKGIHSNKENDPYASKDLSLLRYAVPDYISKNYSQNIVSIKTSPISLGGEGSIIVTLKKNS